MMSTCGLEKQDVSSHTHTQGTYKHTKNSEKKEKKEKKKKKKKKIRASVLGGVVRRVAAHWSLLVLAACLAARVHHWCVPRCPPRVELVRVVD